MKWLDDSKSRLSPEAFRLTDRGQSETALFLDPSSDRNQQLWRYLPLPGWVAPTEALPGTEVFLEATVDKEKHDFESVPLLVARTAGAGRVLYAGFDGTWRWRFEVGDKYHQRYWNQLASWIMEKPFAVKDDFVAIDPGASAYQPGESASLRVRVRDREGKPLSDPDLTVEGLIWKEGKIVATVPLKPAPSQAGSSAETHLLCHRANTKSAYGGRTLRGERAQKPGWVSRKTTGKPGTFDPDLQRGTLAGSRKAIRRNIPA